MIRRAGIQRDCGGREGDCRGRDEKRGLSGWEEQQVL